MAKQETLPLSNVNYETGKADNTGKTHQKTPNVVQNASLPGSSMVKTLLTILIATFILAPIVSGTVGNFTPDRFGTYAEYTGYNPVLPHIQTVVESLGSVTPLPNPLTIFNYQLIVADWGIFEFLRSFLNVILSPLAFTGQFFVSIFEFLGAVSNIFNIA